MILFYSDGRLGNQIFQLAFLKEISKPKETIITFNLKKVLSTFDIYFKINNIELENKIWQLASRKMFFYFFESLAFLKIINIIYEDFNNINYNKKGGLLWFITYVRTGFFQSEKFFNKDKFLSEVKIKGPYLKEAQEFLKNIPENFTKIFIHVRRGDYLTEVFNNKRGINLPLDYYNKAIELVNKEINNPYYIILSDDVEFVEIAFNHLEHKVISHNSFVVDLAVMTLCDGGIISNSSYSWWGAFLLKNKKVVIMPKHWYGWKDKMQSHKGINLSFADVIEF